jgi:molybdenum cofactor cytidylyltransferase
MPNFSGIITAAGKSSRMIGDFKTMGLPEVNKLILEFDKNKTIIETTISNVLNTGVDECIIVLGHFKDEIIKEILKIDDDRIKIVYNNPVDVDLSVSLYNGLIHSKSEYILAVAGDQSNITTETYKNLIKCFLDKKDNNFKKIDNGNKNNKYNDFNNENKLITVLRRKKIGELNSAEGLGMPFVGDKNHLIKFTKNKNSNLNPILREMNSNGFKFFAIKEKNELELLNINKYNDYKQFLK